MRHGFEDSCNMNVLNCPFYRKINSTRTWSSRREEFLSEITSFLPPKFEYQRFQPSRIFRDCPEIKHHVPKSQNTISLSRIKAFSSTFEENAKFLFFHSSKNLFFFKLTSYSTAISTIFKYFKSRRWCLLKNSSSSVLLYLDNLTPRP